MTGTAWHCYMEGFWVLKVPNLRFDSCIAGVLADRLPQIDLVPISEPPSCFDVKIEGLPQTLAHLLMLCVWFRPCLMYTSFIQFQSFLGHHFSQTHPVLLWVQGALSSLSSTSGSCEPWSRRLLQFSLAQDNPPHNLRNPMANGWGSRFSVFH